MASKTTEKMARDARPQDVIAALAGVNLGNTLRVIRALRTLELADYEVDFTELYDECCDAAGGPDVPFLEKPTEFEKMCCSAALELFRQNEHLLPEGLDNIKHSELWYPQQ